MHKLANIEFFESLGSNGQLGNLSVFNAGSNADVCESSRKLARLYAVLVEIKPAVNKKSRTYIDSLQQDITEVFTKVDYDKAINQFASLIKKFTTPQGPFNQAIIDKSFSRSLKLSLTDQERQVMGL